MGLINNRIVVIHVIKSTATIYALAEFFLIILMIIIVNLITIFYSILDFLTLLYCGVVMQENDVFKGWAYFHFPAIIIHSITFNFTFTEA